MTKAEIHKRVLELLDYDIDEIANEILELAQDVMLDDVSLTDEL